MKSLLRSPKSNSAVSDATRDLVIVIVGILAALWLESWWQDQEDRKTERDILQNLRAEYARNNADLQAKLAIWSNTLDEMRLTHTLIGESPSAEDIAKLRDMHKTDAAQPDPLARADVGGFFFDPRHGQLTSVINSGQLALITNTTLRAQIADWPAMVADMDLERQIFMNLLRVQPEQAKSTWPDSQFPADYNELIRSREFDVWLYNSSDNMIRMHQEGRVVVNATNEIISLIDAELAK